METDFVLGVRCQACTPGRQDGVGPGVMPGRHARQAAWYQAGRSQSRGEWYIYHSPTFCTYHQSIHTTQIASHCFLRNTLGKRHSHSSSDSLPFLVTFFAAVCSCDLEENLAIPRLWPSMTSTVDCSSLKLTLNTVKDKRVVLA